MLSFKHKDICKFTSYIYKLQARFDSFAIGLRLFCCALQLCSDCSPNPIFMHVRSNLRKVTLLAKPQEGIREGMLICASLQCSR